MQCNIDARGKRARFLIGVVVALAALAGLVLKLSGVLSAAGWWWVIALAAAAGLFTLFQARAGWCAVRAMGFKTRM